jgi:hypothetical protein
VAEVCVIEWHIAPFRADRWLEIWEPAVGRAAAFGARNWSLTRSLDDPLLFSQSAHWDNRDDFERYWYSDEIAATRERAIDYYAKPVLPAWHTVLEEG